MNDHTSQIDVQAFTRWMDEHDVPGKGEIPNLGSLSGGSQNELTIIERGGRKMVMRKPPHGAAADRFDGNIVWFGLSRARMYPTLNLSLVPMNPIC